MTEGSPLLRMDGITKHFSGVTALEDVGLELRAGEVHALVGENGAGKSTLIKVLTGAYQRDAGEILLEGEPVEFRNPAEAQERGVVAVHQEIHLLAFRTVAENIFVGREPRRWGLVDWPCLNREAAELLERLGLRIDPRARLGSLSTAEQQMVAITRGVSFGARVLVLDEPSSSLAEREVGILYDLIRRLREQGTAIIYISHRFDELYAVCDRVTVLRDGRLVATRELEELDRLDLVCLMLGKSREDLEEGATGFGEPLAPQEGAPLLRVDHLQQGRKVRDVTFAVHSGEIVGLAGLLGSGRTETARVIFGIEHPNAGTVYWKGAPADPRSPHEAIGAGMSLLAEDRKLEGIIPELSVRENLTLAALPALSRLGIVSRSKQQEIVDRFMDRLGIKAASADQKIRELSGGNQQKVLLARCLCTRPELLILDEPTRGIDIGAKAEIQTLVNELASSGLGVLMISSELEEIVEGCSRVVVLREGETVTELRGGEVSADAIVHAMASHSMTDGGAAPPAAGAD